MGKAVVLAEKPNYLGFKKRSMVVVHREELVNQLASTFTKWNPTRTVGIEMADQASSNQDLIVASIQSIGKSGSTRLKKFNPEHFDSIDVDEAHHTLGETYQNVLNHFNVYDNTKLLTLGVTATPNRADGKGLGKIFQEIVYDYSLLKGIQEGWLSDLRGIRITTDNSLDTVHTHLGDFKINELTGAVNTPKRNDLIARSWISNGEDRQTVVFAVDVQHAKDLAEAFKAYGISCEAIWGSDPDRAEKLKYHKEGKLKVLVNCQILTEGYDDWRIGCIVLARPTKSETLYTQIVGRGTRIPEGINNLVEAREKGLAIAKEDCLLIDVVDLTSRHSLVSLPSLFGMNKDMNLKGKKISSIVSSVEALKKKHVYIDLSDLKDVDKIKSYTQVVDLFKVSYSPEIIQYSEYQWHKVAVDEYLLTLANTDFLRIKKDMLENWNVTGVVKGEAFEQPFKTFTEAINHGDDIVRRWGGASYVTLVKRESKWHADPPTENQIRLCKKHNIPIPEGATKGEVSKRINKLFMEWKVAREARMGSRVA